VPLEKAVDLVESTDKNRAKFVHSFTKHDMTDATQYDITLDTGVLGEDQAVNIILNYIQERFPEK
jgi:cytidylate kinase